MASAAPTETVPSLEQLPPEKGSILELHSINEEYNGTVVEYCALDKRTGNHQVVTYDKNAVAMQVKLRVLRRLPLKPLKLRVVLHNVAMGIIKTLETNPKPDADRKSLESLLKKDPCCSVAHFALALLEHTTRPQVDVVKQLQRGLANAYAYEGIIYDSQIKDMKSFLASILSASGDFKASRRVLKNVQGDRSIKGAIDQFTAGNAIFAKANGYKEKGNMTKYREFARVAADHMLNVFKLLSRLDIELTSIDRRDAQTIQTITASAAKGLEEAVLQDNEVLEVLHAEQATRHNVDEKGNSIQTKEMIAVWKRMLRLSKGLLDACTAKDGTVKYLDSRQQRLFNLTMTMAAQHVEANER